MRIFVLGDSFSDNILKHSITTIDNVNPDQKGATFDYVRLLRKNNLPDPLHFQDHLRLWGHEVINLAQNGVSNYSIFDQFANIDQNFKESDRLIINWTGLNRFNWIGKRGNNMVITGGKQPDYDTNIKTKILCDQGVYRMESAEFEHGHLRRSTVPFMNYLIKLHEKYKPIVWTPITHTNIFKNEQFFFWHLEHEICKKEIPDFHLITISGETRGDIFDGHYGRYGNYYIAVAFNTILEYTHNNEHDGYYIKDDHLTELIFSQFRKASHNFQPIPK